MKTVRIRLLGGPSNIPPHERERTVHPADLDDRVRVPLLVGYEHFYYAGEDEAEA